jgi:hypothetical protein
LQSIGSTNAKSFFKLAQKNILKTFWLAFFSATFAGQLIASLIIQALHILLSGGGLNACFALEAGPQGQRFSTK